MTKLKEKQLRDGLIELGPEKLANLLIEIASKIPEAKEVIDRNLSSPQDNLKRFKKRLSGLKRRKSFITWRESGKYANNLISILENIGEDNPDHKSCLKAIAQFYSSDRVIFEQCDDSNGTIGDIFKIDAAEHFRRHAKYYEDKDWIYDLIIEMNSLNDYGVRDCLFDDLHRFLSTKEMKEFAGKIKERAENEKIEQEKKIWFYHLSSVALQLKDADLYKEAQQECYDELHSRSYLDIATIHFENEEYEKALHQLEAIKDTLHIGSECKDLRLKIYQKQGNDEEAEKIVLEKFQKSRSRELLDELLSFLEEKDRQKFIDSEVKSILSSSEFSMQDLNFLIELDYLDEAEKYVLKLKGQVNGDWYYALLPISKSLESKDSLVAASICYRALVDSILKRAKSKTYHHAVSYLKKLDIMSPNISDWKGVENHKVYKERLKEAHKLKSSFWRRYSG